MIDVEETAGPMAPRVECSECRTLAHRVLSMVRAPLGEEAAHRNG